MSLETQSLVKSFGGLRAVDDVSIRVEPGTLTLLVGPNGSGKTTLVNTITGVYKPDSGDVFFNERRITGLPLHEIYKRGLVGTFQTPALFPKMTVLENLLVAARGNPGERFVKALITGRWVKAEEAFVRKAHETGDYAYLLVAGRVAHHADCAEMLNDPELSDRYLGIRAAPR